MTQSDNSLGGGLFNLLGQLLGGATAAQPTPQPAPSDTLGDLASQIGGGPITQLLFGMFGPELTRRVAELFNIDERNARQILLIAIPLLLSALARNSETKKGATSLHGALERDHDGSALSSLDEILADPKSRKGDKIVKKMLGTQAPTIEQTLTEQTGVDGARLLQTLAPIVMGALGQQTREQGLDAAGVADTLQSERSSLQGQRSDIMDVVNLLLTTQTTTGR
ncbi:MAG: hypothetical protein Fur005_02120 [Roseiflexaceae bacterium]